MFVEQVPPSLSPPNISTRNFFKGKKSGSATCFQQSQITSTAWFVCASTKELKAWRQHGSGARLPASTPCPRMLINCVTSSKVINLFKMELPLLGATSHPSATPVLLNVSKIHLDSISFFCLHGQPSTAVFCHLFTRLSELSPVWFHCFLSWASMIQFPHRVIL